MSDTSHTILDGSTEQAATIAFIGGGNMASSLIGGLVEHGYPAANICASDPLEAGRTALSDAFGIRTTDDNHLACQQADVIVLAVKPQILKAVASHLAPAIDGNPAIVSIAAGIPVSALQGWFGNNSAIVRCMPNTPALVHQGASGLFATPAVTDQQKNQVAALFNAVGIMRWLDNEAAIDAVTALSGSGPAYFFLLMEAMENAGVAQGLDRQTAKALCLQTALGAATMASTSDCDIAELRRRVSSPAGTTEAAVNYFLANGFANLVDDAMTAANQRATEMAQEFSQ